MEWKPEYLKHETSSLLGHISLPPGAGAGREGPLPANLAPPEAVSNRDKPGLQGNRDTPLFAKLTARPDGLFHEKLSQEKAASPGSLARICILK